MPLGVHHRQQRVQVGGVELVAVRERVPDVLRLTAVRVQQVDEVPAQALPFRVLARFHAGKCCRSVPRDKQSRL